MLQRLKKIISALTVTAMIFGIRTIFSEENTVSWVRTAVTSLW